MRPSGCGGAGASASLPSLDDVHRHRLRADALHLRPRRSQRGHLCFHHGLLGRRYGPMEPEELARHTIEIAARAGASAAEAIVRQGSEFSTVVRLGSVEKLLQANFRKLGVRIFCGSQSAASSTSDFSPETVGRVVADTVAMARAAPAGPSLSRVLKTTRGRAHGY